MHTLLRLMLSPVKFLARPAAFVFMFLFVLMVQFFMVPVVQATLTDVPVAVAQDGEDSFKVFFEETEGAILDFAILSSVQTGYFRDLIGGGSYVGAQSPIAYVTPYITVDVGYISGYDDKARGALMIGGSFRLNRFFGDAFKRKLSFLNSIPVVKRQGDRIWIGPWVSKRFSDFGSDLMAGVKAGLRW